MAILTFNGSSYTVDHAVKGSDYIHGYDVNGNPVIAIEGIKDFSIVQYDGEYLAPGSCFSEACNEVRCVNGKLVMRNGEVVGTAGGNLTLIDVANFDNGSFTEIIDGKTVQHEVLFDANGKLIAIDGVAIELGDNAELESTEYPGCTYMKVDGENEWVNPPMIPGEFYRTQERHNGSPVYMACIQHKKATGSNSTTMVYQGKLMLMAYPHIISLSGVVSNSYGEAYPSYRYGDLKTWYDEGELLIDFNVTEAMPESTVDIIVKFTLD